MHPCTHNASMHTHAQTHKNQHTIEHRQTDTHIHTATLTQLDTQIHCQWLLFYWYTGHMVFITCCNFSVLRSAMSSLLAKRHTERQSHGAAGRRQEYWYSTHVQLLREQPHPGGSHYNLCQPWSVVRDCSYMCRWRTRLADIIFRNFH